MSKSRGKHRPRKRAVRKRKPPPERSKPKPLLWTWKDTLRVVGTVFGLIVLAIGLCVFLTVERHSRTIERRVEQWEIKYDLSESQSRKLLEMEREYYGNGNPFTIRSKPTTIQRDAHRREIRELLHMEVSDREAEAPSR